MKIVIAPDSFKESMSAKTACDAIEKGIHLVQPEFECIKIPMADGGEGTLQSICDALQGEIKMIESVDVFHQPIKMPIGVCNDIVVIESASCVGLDRIPPAKRNIWKSSTYGLGIAIKEALILKPKKMIICLGGSATNDMGLGMLQALGVTFYDINETEVNPIPENMLKIKSIDISDLDIRLSTVEIVAACDVQNPLCGEQGASYIFGPQKGANPEEVKELDSCLRHVAKIANTILSKDILTISGGGAAGGLGSTLYSFLQASLQPGIDIVKDVVQLDFYIKNGDLVISGEGSLDEQTLYGKTCSGILQSATKYNVPMIVFAGSIKPGARVLYDYGLTAYYPIVHQVKDISQLLIEGPENLTNAVENVFRLCYNADRKYPKLLAN